MKLLSKLVLVAIVIGLSACASTGNEKIRTETESSIAQKFTKGVTTKAQVKESLGAADSTSFTDNGNEIWKYTHLKSTAKAVNFIPFVNLFAAGADNEKKEIVILFDKNGVIQNYTMSESQGETRTGIFAK